MKRFHTAAAFCLACLLAGCAGRPSSSAPVQSQPPFGEQTAPLRQCVPGTDEGYYETNQYFPGGSSLTYVDYATMQQIFLCGSPNCTHDSSVCPSFYPNDGKTQLAGVQTAGGRLLAIQTAPSNTANAHIDCLRPDGVFQSQLVELAAGQELGMRIWQDYYTDDAFLYTILAEIDPDTAQKQESIIRISLSNGSIERLYETPQADFQLDLQGASGRSLLFWEYDARTVGKNGDIPSRLCSLNVDTGSLEEIPVPNDEGSGLVVSGGRIYSINFDASRFEMRDLAGKTTVSCNTSAVRQEVLQKYPVIVSEGLQDLPFAQRYCMLTFSVQDKQGEAHQVAYIYDMNTGKAVPFTLMQTFRDDIAPVCAQTPQGLLVKKDILPQTHIDAGGLSQELYLTEWAMIAPEDYLASTPAYSASAVIELP